MNRLQSAFDAEPVPRDLEAKVRARLEQRSFTLYPRFLTGIALLVILFSGVGYFSISETNRLLRVGIADHFHCGIQSGYPKQDARKQMVDALGPYSVMLQPILDQMPADPVVSAHRCTINGRDYVHFIVRRGATLVSVVMTKKKDGEFYPRSAAALFTRHGSVQLHTSRLDGYSASGFTLGGYFGYVVSALPESENTELAEKIAPVIRRYTGA